MANNSPFVASDEVREQFEKAYCAFFNKRMSVPQDRLMTPADVESMRGDDGDYREYSFMHGCWCGFILANDVLSHNRNAR